MYDIFTRIREGLEAKESRRIPTKTLLNLNPSSQACIDLSTNENMGTCLRQIWFNKNDFERTNTMPVNNISNLAGNWYEDWFVSELKNCGLYYNSSFPATDPQRLVKGIVDIALLNPVSSEIEIGEVKSYDGSNYYGSQSVLGNKTIKPKPKDKHLLQAFRYSLIFKETIKVNNLFYVDRACSTWNKNKQFKIELNTINGISYPKISTVWNEEYYEYTDTRISDKGIYLAEETLLEYFGTNTVPPRDFIEEYSSAIIEEKYASKEIPDYLYTKHKRDPLNNPIGSSSCKYCPYSKGLCKTYEDSL